MKLFVIISLVVASLASFAADSTEKTVSLNKWTSLDFYNYRKSLSEIYQNVKCTNGMFRLQNLSEVKELIQASQSLVITSKDQVDEYVFTTKFNFINKNEYTSLRVWFRNDTDFVVTTIPFNKSNKTYGAPSYVAYKYITENTGTATVPKFVKTAVVMRVGENCY